MARAALEMDLRQLKRLPAYLKDIAKAGANIDKPLKMFGVYMLGQTDKTFRDSGRGPERWAPLSPATLSIRESTGGGNLTIKPLHGHGFLRRSPDTALRGSKAKRRLLIFTRVKYASYHQHGARIRVFGRGELKTLPQRKILFFTKQDERKAITIFGDYAKNVKRKAQTKKV